ncbi:MAG: aminotransferase class IV, partial [Candidatus Micrarchaeota archaeon]
MAQNSSIVPAVPFDVFSEIVYGSPPFREFDNLIQIEGTDVLRFPSTSGVRHLSRSIQYAKLLFEGTRADRILVVGDRTVERATCMFHLDENLKRLAAGARELGIKLNAGLDELFFAYASLIVINGMHEKITYNGEEVKTLYGRPFTNSLDGYFIGLPGEGKGIVTTILIPFKGYDTSVDASKGIVAVFSNDLRPRGDLPSPNIKAGMNYVWAAVEKNKWDALYAEWVQKYPEWAKKYPKMTEVLMATNAGTVAEGSVDNIAMVRKTRTGVEIVTPRSACLPGFTMQLIGLIAQEHRIPFKRSDFTTSELLEDKNTAAVFITGTAMGPTPVDFIANPALKLGSGIKGREYGSSQDPTVKFLIGEYNQVLSSTAAYGKWDLWMDLRDLFTAKQVSRLEQIGGYIREERAKNPVV